MAENGEFVVPGSEVGFSEEFIPGDGTYEENGKIFASRTGVLKIDPKERKVSVKPSTSLPAVPKKGDIVLGIIADIKQQLAIVDVLKIKGIDRALSGSGSGGVHISQVREKYVADLSGEFSAGDIILAKVTNTERSPMSLSTVDKDLGVIKSYCSFCSAPLTKIDDKLKCENCNRTVQKKVSSEYGKGNV